MLTREDCIEQSIQDFVRAGLDSRGYTDYELREGFPYDQADQKALDHNLVALGFNFDDGGEAAECGSSLIFKRHTIEVWIFGKSLTWGRNLSHIITAILETETSTLPLYDYSTNSKPEMDRLVVDNVRAERQIHPDPAPWQQFVWTVTVRVEDTYSAAVV